MDVTGSELTCNTKERRDTAMDKDSVMYQLMDLRVNTIMNSIVGTDSKKLKKLVDEIES